MSTPWYDIVLATLGAVAMILIPLIIWLYFYCPQRKLKQAEKKSEECAIAELEKCLQDEITTFKKQNPEASESNTVANNELEKINHKWYLKISEVKRSSEKAKGRRESVSCCRIFSATLYIFSWIWLLFIVIYVPLGFSDNTLLALFIVAAVGLGVGIIVIWIESIFSRERRYLKNLDSTLAIVELLTTLRATPPNMSLHAEAYHYETRTRHVSYTDSRGNRRTRTETYQQKVVTGTFCEVFQYAHWKDESEATIENISTNRVTRIKMDLVVEFGDTNTQIAFNRQYDLFKELHKNKDTHVDFSESRTVAGFESRLAAYTDLNEKPWWIRERYYCVASLLFLTWPYRVMFNRITAKTSYTLVKSVQCESVSSGNVFIMPMSTNYGPPQFGEAWAVT